MRASGWIPWKRISALLAILSASASSGVFATTAEQARDMPEKDLAKQVLGEAGQLFPEVRRPDWQDGAMLVANRPIEGQAPPLHWLDFYQHPQPVISADRVEGLCEALRATIRFSTAGDAEDFHVEDIYGLSEHVVYGSPYPSPSHTRELYARCSNTSARGFFESRLARNDVIDAIYAVHQVHEAMYQSGAPWLSISCSAIPALTSRCNASYYSTEVDVDKVRLIGRCPPGWGKDGSRQDRRGQCWDVTFGGIPCMLSQMLTIIVGEDRDSVKIRSAVFQEAPAPC